MAEKIFNNKVDRAGKRNSIIAGPQNAPYHQHIGPDSPQIKSNNLVPYTILRDQNRVLPDTNIKGKIFLWDYSRSMLQALWNWGINIFLGLNEDGTGNGWEHHNIADFYCSAELVSVQTIADATTEVILWDSGVFNRPLGYDPLTGQFNALQDPQNPSSTIIYNSWYLVTASVGITPSAPGGSVDINIEVDGSTPQYVTVANPGIG